MGAEDRNRGQTREDLTGEHPLGDAGQILFACLFGVVWIGDTFFFEYSTFLNQYVPLAVRIVSGIVLVVLSGYLARTSLSIVFGEQRPEPEVIWKSVFGLVRHPVYLSEILFYLGLLLVSISLLAAVVWLLAIGFLHHISRHEERLLLARFGAEYERYMSEVPMWVPRLRRSERIPRR